MCVCFVLVVLIQTIQPFSRLSSGVGSGLRLLLLPLEGLFLLSGGKFSAFLPLSAVFRFSRGKSKRDVTDLRADLRGDASFSIQRVKFEGKFEGAASNSASFSIQREKFEGRLEGVASNSASFSSRPQKRAQPRFRLMLRKSIRPR